MDTDDLDRGNHPPPDHDVRQRKSATSALPNAATSAPSTGLPPNSDTNNNSKQLPYSTTSEYCQALNQWMLQCYYLQCLQQLSCPLITLGAVGQSTPATTGSTTRPFATASQVNAAAAGNERPAANDTSRVFALPKIWKRCVAELVDFLFLLVLKVMVTYIAIDYFDLVDLAKYEINLLEEEFDAYQLAYELTSEILIIESIHRLLVIMFETLCLARSTGANHVGGATPGKALMGLRVISCTHLEDLGNGTIRVTPAQDIGFMWALLRALIKNLSSIFFLPASLTIFVSTHNRTA